MKVNKETQETGMGSVRNPLETEPVGKLILRYGVPSVVAMLVNALYNIVDQIFIGRGVGYLGNGAANVVLLLTLVTLAISLLLGDGAAAYFSLSLGAGERDKAAEGAGTALVLITVSSIVIMAAGLMYLEPVIRLFGGTDVLMPYAMDYGRIIVMGLPFIMISTAINALIRADGSPGYAMASMIVGAVVNGCLDPVFIFGFGWGMKGAAVSTLIGQAVSFGLSVAYLGRFRHVEPGRLLRSFRIRAAGRICALGISSFTDQIAFTLVMTVNNRLIVHYGAETVFGSEIPLTAYGIAMKVQEILFTVLLGIAIGMQPVVGYNYGAGQYGRVRKAFWTAAITGTMVSFAATCMFVFAPGPIIGLFGAQDQILYYEFAERFFKTYFLMYIFFGFQTITGVFFQATGKPVQASVISLSYQLVFKILSAVLLTSVIGLDGVLWSGPIADSLIFLLAALLVWKQLRSLTHMERTQTVSRS